MSFADSKTFLNLANAFAGESQARNRYVFSVGTAKKEGFAVIQQIFLETAENEHEHAKVFYKLLIKHAPHHNLIHVNADYPLALGDTLTNLRAAAAGEKEEWEIIYADFGDTAEHEGYLDAAKAFRTIATVENHHYLRYTELAEALKNGSLFRKSAHVDWKCTNCGYVHRHTEAPLVCPACDHPQGFFIDLPKNY